MLRTDGRTDTPQQRMMSTDQRRRIHPTCYLTAPIDAVAVVVAMLFPWSSIKFNATSDSTKTATTTAAGWWMHSMHWIAMVRYDDAIGRFFLFFTMIPSSPVSIQDSPITLLTTQHDSNITELRPAANEIELYKQNQIKHITMNGETDTPPGRTVPFLGITLPVGYLGVSSAAVLCNFGSAVSPHKKIYATFSF